MLNCDSSCCSLKFKQLLEKFYHISRTVIMLWQLKCEQQYDDNGDTFTHTSPLVLKGILPALVVRKKLIIPAFMRTYKD